MATASAQSAPSPSFDWEMTPRYGMDANGDGIVDSMNTAGQVCPTVSGGGPCHFELRFDACASTGVTTYRWFVDHIEVTMTPRGSPCRFSHRLPEDTYTITLRGENSSGWAEVSHQVIVQDWLILSLGDSFGSGEGVPDIPLATADLQALGSKLDQVFNNWGTHLSNAVMDLQFNTPVFQEAVRRFNAVKPHLDEWKTKCPGTSCLGATKNFFDAIFRENFGWDLTSLSSAMRAKLADVHAAWTSLMNCSGVTSCASAAVAWTQAVAGLIIAIASEGWAAVKAAFEFSLTNFINTATATFQHLKNVVKGWEQQIKGAFVELQDLLRTASQKVRWQNRQCHRSAKAGSALAAKAIEDADPKTSVTFVHLACSGATVVEGIIGPYVGIEPGAPVSQIVMADTLVGSREVDAIYTSIGGNDARFADIVKACVLLDPCYRQHPSPIPNELERNAAMACLLISVALGSISPQFSRCSFVLKRLGDWSAEHLYTRKISEYLPGQNPTAVQLANDGFNGSSKPGTKYRGLYNLYNELYDAVFMHTRILRPGQEDRFLISEYLEATRKEGGVSCSEIDMPRGVPLVTEDEYQWIDTNLNRELNQRIGNYAQAVGWTLVDGIGTGSREHGICANDNFLNRFQDSFLTQGGYHGAIHPNARGHQLYRDRILAKLMTAFYPTGDLRQPRRPDMPLKLFSQVDLGLVMAGYGQTSIASSPSGIDCGLQCHMIHEGGEAVELVAAPRTDMEVAAGRLAFIAEDSVWTVKPNGADPFRVTPTTHAAREPAWSPDGSKIAFTYVPTREDDPGYGIWTVNPDGSGAAQVTREAEEVAQNDTAATWSPDASKIAFTRGRDLFVMDAGGTNVRSVTGGIGPAAGAFHPSWSPDGTKIAFSDGADVFTVAPDGTGLTQVTSSADLEDHPSWTPDGTRIVFANLTASTLMRIAPNGTGLADVATGAVDVGGVAHSPATGDTRIALIRRVRPSAVGASIVHGSTGSATDVVPDAAPYGISWGPVPETRFVGWEGGGCTGIGTCSIPALERDTTIWAVFEPLFHRVVAHVDLGGSVRSEPGGMTCGVHPETHERTCSGAFEPGASVTLEARPDAGYRFEDWGATCQGGGPICTLEVTGPVVVGASFVPVETLTLGRTGSGTGILTADLVERGEDDPDGPSDAALHCGEDCTGPFDRGSEVEVVAVADPGSRFVGWTGECAGITAPSCRIEMGDDREVSAIFTRLHDLYVATAGQGGGTVVTDDGRIDCADDCRATYTEGTEVTLTATPDPRSRFAGWDGACSGSEACTVTMGEAHGVVARFEPDRSVSLTASRGAATFGDAVTLSGTVTSEEPGCRSAVDVTIERRVLGTSTWGAVGTATTSAEGAFSRALRGDRSAVYRASLDETSSCASAATGPGPAVLVHMKVTLRASKASAPKGSKVTLTATYAPCPGHAGLAIALHAGARKIAEKRAGAGCSASFTVTLMKRTTFTASVAKPHADHEAGVSPRVTVRAT
jgi:hypothetical protein